MMNILSNLEVINQLVVIITSLGSGGLISALVTWKYQRKKRKIELDNLVTTNDSAFIGNAKNMVELYNSVVEDLTKSYNDRVNEYKRRVDELDKKYQELIKVSELQREKINELSQTVKELNYKLSKVRQLADKNCTACDYYEDCVKRKSLEQLIK